MARLIVLGNPTSGGGRGRGAFDITLTQLRQLGHAATPVVKESAAAAETEARHLAERADALVVVGGDGAVHLGINICLDAGLPLGIVPAGSGNDFAAALGLLPHQIEQTVRALSGCLDDGWTRPVDAVRLSGVSDRAYGAILACGFDAAINARANAWRWRSGLKYPAAVLRELPGFRPIPYRLTVDGVTREVEGLIVAVANTPSYGGGLRILPSARIDDGLIDLAVLHPVATPEFLRVFGQLRRGTHVHHPQVELLTARDVTIEPLHREVLAFADGEAVGPLPMRAVVKPGALRVLARAGGPGAGDDDPAPRSVR